MRMLNTGRIVCGRARTILMPAGAIFQIRAGHAHVACAVSRQVHAGCQFAAAHLSINSALDRDRILWRDDSGAHPPGDCLLWSADLRTECDLSAGQADGFQNCALGIHGPRY